MAVCGQYRCRDCRILKLYLHSGTQPVIESSQKVSVAPFYVDFDGIERYLKDLAISKFANYWDKVRFTTEKIIISRFKNSQLNLMFIEPNLDLL
jgi:hypothetical protein